MSQTAPPAAKSHTNVLREKFLCLVNGNLVPAESGKTFATTNPATGEKLAEVPACGAEDVSRAVEAAQAAYASWKKLPDDALINHYHNPDNINIIVVGGETSPLWKTSDYGYLTSASIDKWLPEKSASECKDGRCGVPDAAADADYDD